MNIHKASRADLITTIKVKAQEILHSASSSECRVSDSPADDLSGPRGLVLEGTVFSEGYRNVLLREVNVPATLLAGNITDGRIRIDTLDPEEPFSKYTSQDLKRVLHALKLISDSPESRDNILDGASIQRDKTQ